MQHPDFFIIAEQNQNDKGGATLCHIIPSIMPPFHLMRIMPDAKLYITCITY